jgi:hypothetical protein
MKKLFNFSALALSTTLLVACGGGGGGSNTVTPLTGIFIDSPVEGLGYATLTQSGKTLADGSFKYLNGENVSFSLFGKPLFQSKGFDFLTPFDVGDSSINPNYPINLIRFLLAVDVDGDATNGIKLPVYNGVFDVEFNQSLRDFEADINGKVASFLNTNANGRRLATVQEAVAHFNNSISNINPSYNLNFVGKTATSKVINSKCTNNEVAGFQFTFGQNSVQLVGSDGFTNEGSGNCIANAPTTLSFNYVDLREGEFLDCLPNCGYKQLNRISYVQTDIDGRTAVEWSWHTPYTNKIYTVKTILADPSNNNNPASLNTFYEVITLN